jgi:hypothetical protein
MTPLTIATWMLAELNRDGSLYQETAVCEIERRFGAEFTPLNSASNPSIRRDVLAEFRQLSGDAVVWERGEKLWRKRESFDQPGRLQE